jgi:hypothetical protein
LLAVARGTTTGTHRIDRTRGRDVTHPEDAESEMTETDIVWAYWEDPGPMMGAEVSLAEARASGRSHMTVARARRLGYLS